MLTKLLDNFHGYSIKTDTFQEIIFLFKAHSYGVGYTPLPVSAIRRSPLVRDSCYTGICRCSGIVFQTFWSVLPYIGYTGMCCCSEYGFQTFWSVFPYIGYIGYTGMYRCSGYGFQAFWSVLPYIVYIGCTGMCRCSGYGF